MKVYHVWRIAMNCKKISVMLGISIFTVNAFGLTCTKEKVTDKTYGVYMFSVIQGNRARKVELFKEHNSKFVNVKKHEDVKNSKALYYQGNATTTYQAIFSINYGNGGGNVQCKTAFNFLMNNEPFLFMLSKYSDNDESKMPAQIKYFFNRNSSNINYEYGMDNACINIPPKAAFLVDNDSGHDNVTVVFKDEDDKTLDELDLGAHNIKTAIVPLETKYVKVKTKNHTCKKDLNKSIYYSSDKASDNGVKVVGANVYLRVTD